MLRRAWDKLTAQFDTPAAGADRRCQRAERAAALGTLALIAATWPLWTPQHDFPRVPVVALLEALERGLLVAAVVGLLLAAVAPRRVSRGGLLLAVVSLVVLVLANQHRFQPWAWQFGLWSVVLLTAPAERAVRLLRLLMASIYVFAALAKLDASFATTLGPEIVNALAAPWGESLNACSPEVRGLFALALPTAELLIGLGLCAGRLRTAALVAACSMHVATIFALGPWGLDHQPGVLLWNLSFAAQGLILFWPGRRASDLLPVAAPRRLAWLAEMITLFALVWPLSESWGWCDSWPAWGLYAARAERVIVLVHASDVARLPAVCRPFVAEEPNEDGWQRLRLERWSLEALHAPIYPQQRFQLAVALAVARRADVLHPLQVIAEHRAGRFTTRRDAEVYWGTAELEAAVRRFWLPAQPLWKNTE